MRIPYKVYELNSDISFLNELAEKYLFCPICLRNVVLKEYETLLSTIWIGYSKSICFCNSCNLRVDPIRLNKVREEKIKKIFKK